MLQHVIHPDTVILTTLSRCTPYKTLVIHVTSIYTNFMSVKHDILSVMSQWAPEDTAEAWDNVGLQLDTQKPIERLAIMLEFNLDTWAVFNEYDYDFVICHHPLIFKPIQRLGHDEWQDQVLRNLIKKDIGLYVSHTNLDRALDGVTDMLMRQYAFDIQREEDLSNGYGKCIELSEPAELHLLLDKVPAVAQIIPNELEIKTIALCGGSGKSFVQDVIKSGVDLFITGELGYHDIQTLRQAKVGILLLGHYQSEAFICEGIKQRLEHLEIEIDIIK